jgi:hypothetical protein
MGFKSIKYKQSIEAKGVVTVTIPFFIFKKSTKTSTGAYIFSEKKKRKE